MKTKSLKRNFCQPASQPEIRHQAREGLAGGGAIQSRREERAGIFETILISHYSCAITLRVLLKCFLNCPPKNVNSSAANVKCAPANFFRRKCCIFHANRALFVHCVNLMGPRARAQARIWSRNPQTDCVSLE